MQTKSLTKEQALQKLRHYCAYQERCHSEVKQKLWELKVQRNDHDEIISKLIEDDYLNEERFVKQYAGGKFRMNDWGKRKILEALKAKQVSPYLLKLAMKEIPEADYEKKIKELTRKKYALLKAEQHLVRKKKALDYTLSKGYEPDLVMQIINNFKPAK